MFVEIVFVGLQIDRDEVEEALEIAFGDDGEVTGAGSGMGQCHLDLEIEERADRDEALRRLERVLAELGASESAQVFVRA
ncbi:hypothetical protein OIE66_18505 [Nonomuraea sp. NBC_01738]|uniref:hypothetical protein n=1 Tax=Nonomuraea sp. NBC_01738 TaxID=2976003 RepID=UPI002E0FEB8D|nr:hypothetical protein OIE66_18505 [Nonomuraea sp. NBC_01738]